MEKNNLNILILDDQDFKINNIRKYLPENANITIAVNMVEGISLLRELEFDYLILDMNFPTREYSNIIEKNGINLIEHVQREKISIKIVVCSSDSVDVSKYSDVIGYIRYDSSVYMKPNFDALIL